MSESKITLAGWQAVVVLVVLMGVVAARLMTFNDMKEDKELMKQLDSQLMTECLPHIAEKLKAAVDSSDKGQMEEAVKSVTRGKVNVESVQASYPLLNFSIPKDVVIKVKYSLDATGASDKRTIYYLFRQGAFGWQFRYKTTAVMYYLNFR